MQVISEMARKFYLEEGFRWVNKCEITVIPSEANILFMSNIYNTAQGKDTRIL